MAVDVTSGVKPEGGQNVYVEVDYYDEIEGGAVRILYNTINETEKTTEPVFCKGEGKWKTAGFVLYAPTFKNDLYLGDFAISGGAKAFQSVCDMLIGGVRVKTLDEVAPAAISIEFSKNPKNYYEGEQLEFTVDYKNILRDEYDLDVKIEIENSYGEIVGTYDDKISLKGMGTLSKTYTPEFEFFGRHVLKVTAYNEELGYVNKKVGTMFGWGYNSPTQIDEAYGEEVYKSSFKVNVFDPANKTDKCVTGTTADIISYQDSTSDFSRIITVALDKKMHTLIVYR